MDEVNESRNAREEWLPELKRQLQDDPLFQAANEAYRKLARQGCDVGVLHGYIGRIAGYKSGNLGRYVIGPDHCCPGVS